MSEPASQPPFDELADVLRGVGLGWVVEQVAQQVRRGRPVTRRRATGEVGRFTVGRIPEDVDVTAEPYTARERLELLAEATARALEEEVALEEALLDFTSDDDDDASDREDASHSKRVPGREPVFVFASAEDELEVRVTEVSLTRDTTPERRRMLEAAALLQELKLLS